MAHTPAAGTNGGAREMTERFQAQMLSGEYVRKKKYRNALMNKPVYTMVNIFGKKVGTEMAASISLAKRTAEVWALREKNLQV